MAKKVTAIVKLQLPAGKATPGPPVGSTLGPHGINIPGFTKEFNAKTQDQAGLIIPVVMTIYQDRSFTFILKTPPAPPAQTEISSAPSNEQFNGLKTAVVVCLFLAGVIALCVALKKKGDPFSCLTYLDDDNVD